MASDDQFLNNLVLRLVKDQLQNEGTCLPSLPEPLPISAEQEQLLEQVADIIRDIIDSFDQNPELNKMADVFARVEDRQNFQMVLDNLFADNVSWGRIVIVICLVGRTAKIHPNSIPSIVSWTQDYYRANLLKWICSRGGWISSITYLVNYTIKQNFGSSSRPISLSCGVLFISGVLLGGLIIWRLNRGS